MSPRVVTYEPGMPSLGRAVVAIGVFDGVHLGHCELLTATAEDAAQRGETAIAVTFDRDPDQVVTPQAAAPQLLTLPHKLKAIKACGIDVVLVVPFTPETAALGPRAFLDEVLGDAAKVSAIHVGEDFRFGVRASGTVETLRIWAVEHGAAVHPHALLCVDGQPVTSTRIRTLVSAGDVEAAAVLLGRAPEVTGEVAHGRGEGAGLGFPTANVHPVAFAAVPGDGIYAARVRFEDDSLHPAAVSVGIPPMFPHAKDYLEAHLIDFSGDLYDQTVTIEFVHRLREQRSYPSLDELKAGIAADVAEATRLLADSAGGADAREAGTQQDQPEGAGSDEDDTAEYVADDATDESHDDSWEESPFSALVQGIGSLLGFGPAEGPDDDLGYDGDEVEDPEALAAAERAVAGLDPTDSYRSFDETWVEVLGPMQLASLISDGGAAAWMIVAPLDAAEIPYAWDPFPPEQVHDARPGLNLWRAFRLLVPPQHAQEAAVLLGVEDAELEEER